MSRNIFREMRGLKETAKERSLASGTSGGRRSGRSSTTKRMPTPTHAQWAGLSWVMRTAEDGRRSGTAGNKRSAAAMERKGWIRWFHDPASRLSGWDITDAGREIEAIGAVPFIPFKSNSVGMSSKSEPWKRMWCHFKLRSEEFRAHYHRRSNVESTMWMIKSKFGGSVRSRLPTAQANEVLAKVLCHNLTCIVHAVAEFGIDVGFNRTTMAAPSAPNSALVQP